MPNYDDASKGKDTGTIKPAVRQQVNDVAGTYSALSDRKIKLETAKKYGVKAQHDLQGRVTKHFYPYYNGHELSATKCRTVNGKGFFLQGTYSDTGLFGQQLFKSGKYVTITEGECDAMAAYELLGSKWAVVSIKRGAAGAVRDIKESLEFFDDFENVIVAFDNDKAVKILTTCYGRTNTSSLLRLGGLLKLTHLLVLSTYLNNERSSITESRKKAFLIHTQDSIRNCTVCDRVN